MDRNGADALIRELSAEGLPGNWSRRSLDGISYGVRYTSPGGTTKDFFNRKAAFDALDDLRGLD